MNEFMKSRQLSKMSTVITKELETILGCDVITTDYSMYDIMRFQIFIDSDGNPSAKQFKIVICRMIKRISNWNVYVEYLIKCLKAKVFVQGNVGSMSTVVYEIIHGDIGLDIDIYYEKIAGNSYKEEKDLFCINEFISIRDCLEEGTLLIVDKRYGDTLMNFNTKIYLIDEVDVA